MNIARSLLLFFTFLFSGFAIADTFTATFAGSGGLSFTTLDGLCSFYKDKTGGTGSCSIDGDRVKYNSVFIGIYKKDTTCPSSTSTNTFSAGFASADEFDTWVENKLPTLPPTVCNSGCKYSNPYVSGGGNFPGNVTLSYKYGSPVQDSSCPQDQNTTPQDVKGNNKDCGTINGVPKCVNSSDPPDDPNDPDGDGDGNCNGTNNCNKLDDTRIVNAINDSKTSITNAVNSSKEAVTAAVNSSKEAVTAAVNGVKSAVDSASSTITGAVNSASNTITGAVTSAKTAITGAIDGVKDRLGITNDKIDSTNKKLDDKAGQDKAHQDKVEAHQDKVEEHQEWVRQNPPITDNPTLDQSPLQIPETDIDYIRWNATCPADENIPISLQGVNTTLTLSWKPLCTLLSKLYYVILACAYISAAYIIVGSGKP